MLLLKILAAVPTALHGILVSFLWWIALPFTGRERQLILANIERVYHMAPNTSFARTFVRQVLESQLRVYVETIQYVFRPKRVKINGVEECRNFIASCTKKKRGVVVITCHLGSWELGGHFIALALGRPFHVLAKPSRTKWINPILDDLRSRLKMSVLWTDAKSLFRDMLKALDAGEGLGFVMDQRPGVRVSGHPVTFMGVPDTLIVSGPAKMIAKKNVAAIGMYCVRQGPSEFRVIATEILKDEHGMNDEAEISKLLAADMERMIRLYPEQWAWNYKRWK